MVKIVRSVLDKLDQQRMGNDVTVSASTLKRLYKYGYDLKKDRRAMNTLDKLSLFLGYTGWDDFVNQKNLQFQQGSIEALLVDIVTKANEAEFQAYKSLPRIETTELLKYRTAEGSGYLRIYNVLVQHSKKGWTIGNEGNPSGYTQQKVWIEKLSSSKAIVKTQEYWYLRWFELPTQLYRHIYNEQNEQTKTLELIDGHWKISSVFYPSPKNSVQITHVVFAYLPKSIQTLLKDIFKRPTD